MSSHAELEGWAEEHIKDAQSSVRQEDNGFIHIDWKVENKTVGNICIKRKDDVLYMLSFWLEDSRQRQGVFKSAAAFFPGWARDQGATQLAVISANETMRGLIAECGFVRGDTPDDYFVDISEEDSLPEQYGNSRP